MDETEKSVESQPQDQDLEGAAPKGQWVKPDIVEFKPVTVARGISYRIGDGISNLS